MFYFNPDIDTDERYDPSKLLEFNEGMPDVITSHFYTEIKKLESYGEYTVISEAGNVPLISYILYGEVEYHEILMVYNDILDISDVKLGNLIKYPSLDDLELLYFKLQALQRGRRV